MSPCAYVTLWVSLCVGHTVRRVRMSPSLSLCAYDHPVRLVRVSPSVRRVILCDLCVGSYSVYPCACVTMCGLCACQTPVSPCAYGHPVWHSDDDDDDDDDGAP